MVIQWPLVLFSLLAGTGGSMLALTGLSVLIGGSHTVRRRAVLCALILLVAGGLCSMFHLASPLNAISAVTNLLSFSGISIELMLLGANFIIGVVYLILTREDKHTSALKVVAVLALIFGISIGFFCGHGYVIDAQPTWNTETLPIAYLGTSLALGAFIYAFFAVLAKESDRELGAKLWIVVLIATLVNAVGIIAYSLFLGFDTAGAQGLVFWGGAMVVGVLAVVVCGVIGISKYGQQIAIPLSVVGTACSIVGGIAIRSIMWTCATGYIDLFSHTIPSVMLNL